MLPLLPELLVSVASLVLLGSCHVAVFSLCLHIILPLCPAFPFLSGHRPIGSGPTLMTSSSPDHLWKGLFRSHSEVPGVRTPMYGSGGHDLALNSCRRASFSQSREKASSRQLLSPFHTQGNRGSEVPRLGSGKREEGNCPW